MESSIPRMVALLVLVSIAEFGAVREHGGSNRQPPTAGKIVWQYDTSG